jgi:hypothetical protein
MKSITLNKTTICQKNHTSKYWRDIECQPQTVELSTWSTEHPLFYLKGKIVNSHDPKEIGLEMDVLIQTYSFWLDDLIKTGTYTIN